MECTVIWPSRFPGIYLLSAEADILLRELGVWIVPATLWAGPVEFLGREELWREQGLLPGAIPHPLLDTLKMEEAVALYTAPHLWKRDEGKREEDRGSGRRWEEEGGGRRRREEEGGGGRRREKVVGNARGKRRRWEEEKEGRGEGVEGGDKGGEKKGWEEEENEG